MTLDEALDALRQRAQPGRATEMRAYHKADRPYLGVANPDTNALTASWRKSLSLPDRIVLARALWRTDIFEARLAAAKLLTQNRIKGDDGPVWALIRSWVPDFDSWAIADHACMAGMPRLIEHPDRIAQVEPWTRSDHLWTRRAALVITLPWARGKVDDPAGRRRILGWAAGYVDDPEWFIQKAVAWWLRELSRSDPDQVRAFLETFGNRMKRFAVREASRLL